MTDHTPIGKSLYRTPRAKGVFAGSHMRQSTIFASKTARAADMVPEIRTN
jgi:hypothetical protein